MANKPELLTASAVSMLNPVMEPFKKVPYPRVRIILLSLIPVLAFLGIMGIAFLVMAIWPVTRYGTPGLLANLPIFLLACVIPFIVATKIGFMEMHHQCREDAQALGNPSDDERYVGVSYTTGIALNNTDSSWDRGWLSFKDGCLWFRGHGPCFALPVHRIESIQVRSTNLLATMMLPRVLVEWRAPDGQLESILFEVRDSGSRREMKKLTDLFASWLEEGRQVQSGEPKESAEIPNLPFRSSSACQAVTFKPIDANAKDKLLGFASACGVILLFEIASIGFDVIFGTRITPIIGGAGFMAAVVTYFLVLTKRQANRRKSAENKDKEESLNLD